MDTNFSFADISLFSSLEHNRAIKRVGLINAVVIWSRIERSTMRNYPVVIPPENNLHPPAFFAGPLRSFFDLQWSYRFNRKPTMTGSSGLGGSRMIQYRMAIVEMIPTITMITI